jgi:hypothetical protein
MFSLLECCKCGGVVVCESRGVPCSRTVPSLSQATMVLRIGARRQHATAALRTLVESYYRHIHSDASAMGGDLQVRRWL